MSRRRKREKAKPEPTTWWGKSVAAAERFVSQPATAKPLAAFRIGIALVLLVQAFSLTADLQMLYGDQGLVQWDVLDPDAGDSLLIPGIPRIRWAVESLESLGLSAATTVRGVFVVYVVSLTLMLIGWRTRWVALLAWLLHLAMNTSALATIYGVDQFANIALFYCFALPTGYAWSADVKNKVVPDSPTSAARLALRLLQCHLCVVYLASGIEKATGAGWWTGEVIWRAMNYPTLNQPFESGWLASYPWLCVIAAWGTLFLEIFYCVFVWPRLTRRWMAYAIISLHLGIAIFMGLHSFAALMIVLSGSAWLVSPEPAISKASDEESTKE